MPSSSSIWMERSVALTPAWSGSKFTTMRSEWRRRARTWSETSAVPQEAATSRTPALQTPIASM